MTFTYRVSSLTMLHLLSRCGAVSVHRCAAGSGWLACVLAAGRPGCRGGMAGVFAALAVLSSQLKGVL